jgi:hypothetical protein
VYNRSVERVDEFKEYAEKRGVTDEQYQVVTDLKEIGRR